jgi:dTDP-glucose 4,6-dehydratase
MRRLTNILVTGGSGFIGCNFIRFMLERNKNFSGKIINLDTLTYAGNMASLQDIEEKFGGKRYFFEHGNICDRELSDTIFVKFKIDTIVHFAAESHVDRSILGPKAFIETNVIGTFTLLETAKYFWSKADASFGEEVLFHHISTDEVYGSLGETGYFTETTPYNPRSPYSASKASSDHLVMAYYHTYGLPVTISNCSNNYGPYQFPEKFIPLAIMNIIENKPIPVYGNGMNIRDWLYVEDHVTAIWRILTEGTSGEKYNIGGESEYQNIQLLNILIDIVAKKTNLNIETVRETITFVTDRPGHDLRYAINFSKIKNELNWKPSINIFDGLSKTVDWYLSNKQWIDKIRSGEYQRWIEQNYKERIESNLMEQK